MTILVLVLAMLLAGCDSPREELLERRVAVLEKQQALTMEVITKMSVIDQNHTESVAYIKGFLETLTERIVRDYESRTQMNERVAHYLNSQKFRMMEPVQRQGAVLALTAVVLLPQLEGKP